MLMIKGLKETEENGCDTLAYMLDLREVRVDGENREESTMCVKHRHLHHDGISSERGDRLLCELRCSGRLWLHFRGPLDRCRHH